MEKIEALANYLGCEVDEIQEGYDDNIFEYGDEEYLVCDDYDDAVSKAEESFLNLVDDLGGEMFDIKGLEWIIAKNINDDWFRDAFEEMEYNYINDIENEEDSLNDNLYENRLIAEMVERDILNDDDFHYAEDDLDKEHPILNDDVDLDAKKDEFVEDYLNGISDFVEEYKWEFGKRELYDVVEQNNLVDWESVAEEVVSQDGPANELASYDGDEIELEDGYYAYRLN